MAADRIPNGTHVSWPYRGTHGHGVVVGVHKAAKTSADTEYSIRESDHHPGEPAIVYHYGRVLTRTSGHAPKRRRKPADTGLSDAGR